MIKGKGKVLGLTAKHYGSKDLGDPKSAITRNKYKGDVSSMVDDASTRLKKRKMRRG